MCGRYLLSLIPEQYAGLLRIDHVPELTPDLYAPRFNIAPTQQILIVRQSADNPGRRELAPVRWGFIPPWTTSLDAIKRPIFNARSETAWEKPTFKDAARARRCVIPADGFYEWRQPKSAHERKQPYLIRRPDASPIFFAGICSSWRPKITPGAPPIESGAILTTTPNQAIAPIHDRMPVILSDPSSIDRWLDPEPADRAALQDLLGPCPASALELIPIDRPGNTRRKKVGPDNASPTLFD